VSAPSRRPRVIVLRCRACRSALPAASHDVAFRCPGCGRAWEIADGELSERASAFVAPPAGAAQPLLYLPYWSFAVSAAAQPAKSADAASLTARDRAAKIARGFVAAYAIHRPTYVGEWGWTYTRIQPGWEVRHGRGPEAPGAVLSSGDAAQLVRHYVLAEIDRAADLAELDVTVELGPAELWAIPCCVLDDRIRCPWTRAELPAAALDDLSEIRRGGERLEA
jgi:predicted RNA-binding Zn-ribbon protein involved in translation (DUF1610 family)